MTRDVARERLAKLLDAVAKVTKADDLAGVRSVCGALGDPWSEVRRACARGLADLSLDDSTRAQLVEGWAAELVAACAAETDWRRAEGLCLALAALRGLTSTKFALENAVATCALVHPSAPVRAAAVAALDEESAPAVVATLRREMAAPRADPERRAAALAGPLAALERLEGVPPLDAPTLRTLLGDRASTVRLAAATLLSRDPALAATMDDELIRGGAEWEVAEACLVARDAIASEDIVASLGGGRAPPTARPAPFAPFFGHQQFEVRRAARQLAATVAISELCSSSGARTPRRGPLGAFMLGAACGFARYCLEVLGDCRPRWGASHDGAGDDSDIVQRREQAAREAEPGILRDIVRRCRALAASSLEDVDGSAYYRAVALLASSASGGRHQRWRAADAKDEATAWRLRAAAWPTAALQDAKLEPLLPDVCAVAACRADAALSIATCLARSPGHARRDSADALAVSLRAALERSRLASPSFGTAAFSATRLPPAFVASLDRLLDAQTIVVSVSCAPWTRDEFENARRACGPVASAIAAAPASTPLLHALVFACAFSMTSLLLLSAGVDQHSPVDARPLLRRDPLVLRVATECARALRRRTIVQNPKPPPVVPPPPPNTPWADWDDDDDDDDAGREGVLDFPDWAGDLLAALENDLGVGPPLQNLV